MTEREQGEKEERRPSKWERLKAHWRRAAELTATPKEATGDGPKAAPAALEAPVTPEPPASADATARQAAEPFSSLSPTPEPDEKQTGGRDKKAPSGSEKRQRMKGVRARVTEAEYAALQGRARAAGLSTAAYLRACALGDKGPRAKRAPTIEGELLGRTIAALNKVGSNINQIAHHLNVGGHPDRERMEEARAELLKCFEAILKSLDRAG